ncbi:MAG: dihydrofolate reductase [Bacillota bacterium]
MSLSVIVAMDENRLIGKDNEIPWHFKKDLKYFKRVTEGHTVVMGRKTYESIVNTLGGPLPNRENIVFTRTKESLEGATIIRDVGAFFQEANESDEEIFVIGGARIYTLALPYVDRLYITHVEGEYEGDTYFPDIDMSMFDKTKEEKDGPLTFAIYERSTES